MKGFVSGYYTFCIWITRFAYLNLLWALFTITGLVIFGFFPATTAMFAVTRKWILGEKEIAIFSTFWEVYKKEFLKSNILGLLLFLVGYVLSIEFQILRTMDEVAYFIASYAVLVFFLILFIVLLYIFPIYTHFNLKVFTYLKWSLVIGMIHPILTVFLMFVVIGLNYAVFLYIPGLLFFFGGSVTAYILMWGVSKTFPKYEQVVI